MKNVIQRLANDELKGIAWAAPKAFLYGISLAYGLLISLWPLFFKSGFLKIEKVNAKVISIGNITWGGTGKTPMVEMIARYLESEGKKVAVLTRGYGRYESMGDEPCMLHEHLKNIPVIVDADRVQGAKKAIEQYGADTLVLDDGFQHRRILRDIDITLIDSTNPFGNGNLVPRGILREPLSALKRADVLVITKTNLSDYDIASLKVKLKMINPDALIAESIYEIEGVYNMQSGEYADVDILKKKPVCSLCAVANPASFRETLRRNGFNVSHEICFEDHHIFNAKDLQFITNECLKKGIDTVLTTEKDAVRLKGAIENSLIHTDKINVFVIKINFRITGKREQFIARLHNLYIS